MARVITAPNEYVATSGDTTLFLAGGICNVTDWQDIVCERLLKEFPLEPLVIFNPRREKYPTDDLAAIEQQIKWEYDMLNASHIFSMFFSAGPSDQPICMYEYGKHLERFSRRSRQYVVTKIVTLNLNRFIVTAEKEYRRYQDVVIQTALVDKSIIVNTTLDEHINQMIKSINNFSIAKLMEVYRAK